MPSDHVGRALIITLGSLGVLVGSLCLGGVLREEGPRDVIKERVAKDRGW